MQSAALSQCEAMDRMYGWQRPIYDLTRRFYLLGRDRLLREMRIEPGAQVLEIGCGTARNLIQLAKRHPAANFYGLDASTQMLATARGKLAADVTLHGRVLLAHGLAENLDRALTFSRNKRFDAIFFSYSLSMIPAWEAAIDAAWSNLRVGGCLYFVDFWDQAKLPKWLQSGLKWWLASFHVHHRPEMLAKLREMALEHATVFQVDEIFGRYAWIGRITKT